MKRLAAFEFHKKEDVMEQIKIIRGLGAFVAVVALVVVTTTSKQAVPSVYASTGCSIATLNGTYGFIQLAGFTTHNSTGGNEVPWQFAGFGTFDGKGNITSTNFTSAVNGAISPNQNQPGTYTMSPDCAGTLSLPGIPYEANIYVISGGAEVFGISTGGGDTATFDAKKQ